jgi:uncharacterized protein (DUF1800 family)
MSTTVRYRFSIGLAMTAMLATAVGCPPAADAQTAPTPRQLAQHLLRRFAFSASPAQVDAVVQEGTAAWLQQQMNWAGIPDGGSQLNQPPAAYSGSGNVADSNVFEALMYQHDILTNRQLQAKLELHWLDHFSAAENPNGSDGTNATIYTYDAAIRANALGNFAQLVSAVAATPEMLWWLTNNGNNASAPNVNWARELMQLFTIGEWQLNSDGSQVLDKNGQPIPNYTEFDIKAMAEAMSGFEVSSGGTDSSGTVTPLSNYFTSFYPPNQYPGTLFFLGAMRNFPHNKTAMNYIVNILANHPSAAPFQVKEMLQRFVTETPDPGYIADIVAVWRANAADPNQIAKVVQAIVNHPHFATSYHAMRKQPIEKLIGVMRQLPGKMQNGSNGTIGAESLAGSNGFLSGMGQQIVNPPNVFSFYYPGNLSSLMNSEEFVSETYNYSMLLQNSPLAAPAAGKTGTTADTWIDVPTVLSAALAWNGCASSGATHGTCVATYLLDALVDGGSGGLQSEIAKFLGSNPSANQIVGAIWLILTSPEYAVN